MPNSDSIPQFSEEELQSEKWRRIVGEPGFEWLYSVSSLGRVRRDDRPSNAPRNEIFPRLLRLTLGGRKGQYRRVTLCRDRVQRPGLVHRLVALAFHGPRPPGAEINHKDTNRWNNRASNLEYLTREEHGAHRVASGQQVSGEMVANSILTIAAVQDIRANHSPDQQSQRGYKYFARKYQVSPSTIASVVKRRQWKHVS